VNRKIKYPNSSRTTQAAELKDHAAPLAIAPEAMLRTQIYLNREEHDFVRREAERRDLPMAAVIREFIDEKMKLPDDAWTNNPMFKPWPHDPNWKGHEDGGINHDHYIYGCPKKWVKVKGEYVESPPLPSDYYSNRVSRDDYDKLLRELDETR
jgi:hypothetical protein